jgi:hypothetical protein
MAAAVGAGERRPPSLHLCSVPRGRRCRPLFFNWSRGATTESMVAVAGEGRSLGDPVANGSRCSDPPSSSPAATPSTCLNPSPSLSGGEELLRTGVAACDDAELTYVAKQQGRPATMRSSMIVLR